jgi:hypothetical protein
LLFVLLVYCPPSVDFLPLSCLLSTDYIYFS